MANTKSAEKQARQNEKRRQRNTSRISSIKTATKKVLNSINEDLNLDKIKSLLEDVSSKLSRAKSKKVIHRNTASRKLSRLTKRVNVHINSKDSKEASTKTK